MPQPPYPPTPTPPPPTHTHSLSPPWPAHLGELLRQPVLPLPRLRCAALRQLSLRLLPALVQLALLRNQGVQGVQTGSAWWAFVFLPWRRAIINTHSRMVPLLRNPCRHCPQPILFCSTHVLATYSPPYLAVSCKKPYSFVLPLSLAPKALQTHMHMPPPHISVSHPPGHHPEPTTHAPTHCQYPSLPTPHPPSPPAAPPAPSLSPPACGS